MDKLRTFLSGRESTPEEESNIISQINEASTLSWSTRIKGFCIMFLLGLFFSFLGSVTLFLKGGLVKFGILYTIGNILSLMSTCFLMGPFKQIKKMFAPTRWIATVIVLLMIVLTLLTAFMTNKTGLVLLFIIIQSLAMTWYSLSYIPYARDAVKKTIETCIV